jgi:putative ABC transport system ATP-binding protein
VFQEFNLIDSLTIRENIGVPLVLANKDKEYINKKVEAISKDLNIDSLLDKFPSECSGGQKQRAAICRALVTNPKMIVADEPTGSLDTKSSHELLKILQERNEKYGIAILMVTHDSMIASYSKKLVFLRDGKIDEEIERKSLTQKEFFYKIVDTTSRESQSLFEAF